MNETIEAFVQDKSKGIAHSGRTFYAHLRGTYDLLHDWGAPEPVCLAGLCHSIYGTNIFHTAAMPLTTRREVAAVIGDEAERLAFIFCSCNRPHALLRAADTGTPYAVINRRSKEPIYLTRHELMNLLHIELANLIEQNSMAMVSAVQVAWRALEELEAQDA